mmetsp:Transcript_11046/g.31462  ORF Transcript_11046/g.31462 Transcript_11046/m.31462 type:complete len:540 (+) Transcript_11046:58-1677(+)
MRETTRVPKTRALSRPRPRPPTPRPPPCRRRGRPCLAVAARWRSQGATAKSAASRMQGPTATSPGRSRTTRGCFMTMLDKCAHWVLRGRAKDGQTAGGHPSVIIRSGPMWTCRNGSNGTYTKRTRRRRAWGATQRRRSRRQPLAPLRWPSIRPMPQMRPRAAPSVTIATEAAEQPEQQGMHVGPPAPLAAASSRAPGRPPTSRQCVPRLSPGRRSRSRPSPVQMAGGQSPRSAASVMMMTPTPTAPMASCAASALARGAPCCRTPPSTWRESGARRSGIRRSTVKLPRTASPVASTLASPRAGSPSLRASRCTRQRQAGAEASARAPAPAPARRLEGNRPRRRAPAAPAAQSVLEVGRVVRGSAGRRRVATAASCRGRGRPEKRACKTRVRIRGSHARRLSRRCLRHSPSGGGMFVAEPKAPRCRRTPRPAGFRGMTSFCIAASPGPRQRSRQFRRHQPCRHRLRAPRVSIEWHAIAPGGGTKTCVQPFEPCARNARAERRRAMPYGSAGIAPSGCPGPQRNSSMRWIRQRTWRRSGPA